MVLKTLPYGTQEWNVEKKDESKIKKRLSLKAKTALGIAVLLSVLVAVVLGCVFGLRQKQKFFLPSYKSESKLGIYKSAAISTDAAPCSPIAKKILQKGGSAVDAAIAALFCMGVVNPQSMGLGGGFLMMIYNRKNEEAVFLDARETAPLKATENMFEGNSTLALFSGLAVAVPGELAGYAVAYEKYGVLPWKELIQPTIDLCKTGIPTTSHLATTLNRYSSRIIANEGFRKVFTNNKTGEVYKEGELMLRPHMAATLEQIAVDGKRALYGPNHPMATKFLNDLKSIDSIISEEDLLTYKPRFLKPISVTLANNVTVFSANIPGSGGLLAFMLNVLDGYNMSPSIAHSREEVVLAMHRTVEAFKFAYAKRFEMEDDLSSMQLLMTNLTSARYAERIRSMIDDSRTHDNLKYYGLKDTFAEDNGTAHMSIIAPNGDAVSVTSTINTYLGSFEISPSTGIVLNNEMNDFALPNITNFFDLPPSEHNRIKPGRRPLSSMCPSIALDGDKNIRLVTGGNGGTKITTGVLLATIWNLYFGQDIKQSIDAPRIHHQLLPNEIQYESNYPKDILKGLEDRGHKIKQYSTSRNLNVILGITRSKDGMLYCNSDYRKHGEVDGF